jgi:hypothetical protein
MKNLLVGFSILLSLMILNNFSQAATYYVRTDGGTAQECNGTVDAPYPGSGTDQPCAWAHPFWVLENNGNWRINGGDTLIIAQNQEGYMMVLSPPKDGPAPHRNTDPLIGF